MPSGDLRICSVCGGEVDEVCQPCMKKRYDSLLDPQDMTPQERYEEVMRMREESIADPLDLLRPRMEKLIGRSFRHPRIPVDTLDPVAMTNWITADDHLPQRSNEAKWRAMAEEARNAYQEVRS